MVNQRIFLLPPNIKDGNNQILRRVIIKAKLKKYILITIGTALAATIASYFVIVPKVQSRDYFDNLQKSARQLSGTYRQLAKSSNLPVFNNPDLSTSMKLQNLNTIQDQINTARRQLRAFGKATTNLEHLPSLGSVKIGYGQAEVTMTAAQNVVSQSNDVFDETDTLTSYMNGYIEVSDKLDQQLSDFNAISDFNSVIGYSQAFSATATAIRGYAVQLKALTPPVELRQFHQETLMTFQQAAAGFDDVAAGLSTGLDNRIYAAVAEVEQVGDKHDSQDKKQFFDAISNSPTLNDLIDLPDKLAQFEMLSGSSTGLQVGQPQTLGRLDRARPAELIPADIYAF